MGYVIVLLVLLGSLGTSMSCSTDTDCPSDASCTDSQCTCPRGYLLSENSSECLPYVTEYNGECSEDAQCEWLGDNSECKYVCRCKDGYRWYLGICQRYVGLGETCSADVECFDGYTLQSLKCSDSKCVCADGYYQRGETDCRKIAQNENDICALDIDCKAENTVCTLGKCKRSNTKSFEIEDIEETTFSYSSIGIIPCNNTDDCNIVSGSTCYEKTGTCICPQKYFFDKDTNSCREELGVQTCILDWDCNIKPGRCDQDTHTCFCRDYYFTEDGNRNCVKTISQNNWNCVSNEWCHALGTYAYCSSAGECNCSKIAELDEENLVCLQNRDKEPGMCFLDSECKYIKNGYCVDEACGCQLNHTQIEQTCYPDLGIQCDKDNVCPAENSECRDGICQCYDSYVGHENKCYLKHDHLGEDCVEDVQCNEKIPYSACVDDKCACDDGHLPHNNTCYPKTDHQSYCNNRLECTLSLGETVSCRNRICQCPTGLTRKGNECSSGNIFRGNVVAIAFVLIFKYLSRMFS